MEIADHTFTWVNGREFCPGNEIRFLEHWRSGNVIDTVSLHGDRVAGTSLECP